MPVGIHRNPGQMYPLPVKPLGDKVIRHSGLSKLVLRWSPGMGIRRPDDTSPHYPGLYLSASVKNGHDLHINKVKLDQAKKTVTIVADARGKGAPARGSEVEEKFVRGGFSMRPEEWKVIVMDPKGKVLAKRSMLLGGPPAP